MKLFNVIVTYDVYCVAESEASAAETIRASIREGLKPSHEAAFHIQASPVRNAWQDERPFVGADVSDADFALLKGKTTQQVHDMLTKKAPKP